MVMMDVAREFPSVAKGRMANKLRAMGLNERITEWVQDFMKERRVNMRIDNQEGDEHEVETGVPQGSPVSLVLFNVFIAPRLRHLEQEASKIECEMITPTFVEDITTVIAGEDTMDAMEKAEKIVKKGLELGENNGIKFERDKTEWLGMSKEKGEEEDKTWSLEIGEEWKEEKDHVRWLGVWVDKEMKFKEHLEKKIGAARQVAGLIKGLCGGKRGVG